MERRTFFNWMGKIALVIGSGRLIAHSEELDINPGEQYLPRKLGEYPIRMNGRACRDFRMLSADRSMMFDREIFNS